MSGAVLFVLFGCAATESVSDVTAYEVQGEGSTKKNEAIKADGVEELFQIGKNVNFKPCGGLDSPTALAKGGTAGGVSRDLLKKNMIISKIFNFMTYMLK